MSALLVACVQGSSRVFRSNRPPASLQQLWAWTCSLTEGRPISSMAWNSANNNLLAAGYGTKAAAEMFQGGAATGPGATGTGISAFAQGQQGSVVGQGPLLNAPRTAGDAGADSADGAAPADIDAAGGCVALWSLKNQFFPVWSFTTKSGKQQAPVVHAIPLHKLSTAVEGWLGAADAHGMCVMSKGGVVALAPACAASQAQLCICLAARPANLMLVYAALCRCHQLGLLTAQSPYLGCGHA